MYLQPYQYSVQTIVSIIFFKCSLDSKEYCKSQVRNFLQKSIIYLVNKLLHNLSVSARVNGGLRWSGQVRMRLHSDGLVGMIWSEKNFSLVVGD